MTEEVKTIEEAKRLWSMHLIQVKALIVQPKKTHKVHVHTNKGRDYDYSYADLKDVDKAVMDACRQVTDKDGKVQFGYYFEVDNGAEGVSVQTVLLDASGYSRTTNKVWFKNVNVGKAQDTASLISYAKRYSLSAAFGIASEDDDDVQRFEPQVRESVDDNTIRIIWNSYINYHDENAKAWIKQKHDKQTASTIMKLVGQYKLNEEAEEKNKKSDEGNNEDTATDPKIEAKEEVELTDKQKDLVTSLF